LVRFCFLDVVISKDPAFQRTFWGAKQHVILLGGLKERSFGDVLELQGQLAMETLITTGSLARQPQRRETINE